MKDVKDIIRQALRGQWTCDCGSEELLFEDTESVHTKGLITKARHVSCKRCETYVGSFGIGEVK